MSILDSLLRPSEKEKIKSTEQSESAIAQLISEQHNFMDMSKHAVYRDIKTGVVVPNTYKFTVKLLSLDFLNKISKDKRVKNVFFSARHSHPGGASDSISLRQRVIVQYY